MKIVLEIDQNNRDLKENDLIIFKDNKWQVIQKDKFLKPLYEENQKLETKCIKIEKNLLELAKILKEKNNND